MCGFWKIGVVPLDISTNGLAFLYVPNLSLNSYTLAKNDGLPFLFTINYVVYSWTSYWLCWGDDERDGNHLVGFIFEDIDLSL
jgi:hypothetical protein